MSASAAAAAAAFGFGFVFRHFACPFGLLGCPFFAGSRLCLLLFHGFAALSRSRSRSHFRCHCHSRVVFNIICLSTCCGICSRQQRDDWREGRESRERDSETGSTRTRRATPTCTLLALSLSLALSRALSLCVCVCLLSLLPLELPFFFMSAFPLTTVSPLPPPSFLLESCKPLIFGYVFLHFCSLFAFDLIVGSGCAASALSLSLSHSHSFLFALCVPAWLLYSLSLSLCLLLTKCLQRIKHYVTSLPPLCPLPCLVDCLAMSATESQRHATYRWHSCLGIPSASFSV